MINSVDFTPTKLRLSRLFAASKANGGMISSLVDRLCMANLECYKANMGVIAERHGLNRPDIISDFEFIARTVGEDRVACKLSINRHLSDHYPASSTRPASWIDDDVVYSVGEMVDRITIEAIKQADFEMNNQDWKLSCSVKWQERVYLYLGHKLALVHERNSYECVEEMRTYII